MLQLDYTNMMADVVPGAITGTAWDDVRAALEAAHADVTRQHADQKLGFIDLPDDKRLLDQSLAIAQWAADECEVRDVVVPRNLRDEVQIEADEHGRGPDEPCGEPYGNDLSVPFSV